MECLKFLMFGFNIVFWLAGAAMMGVGIWLAVDPAAFEALGAVDASMDNEMWAIGVYTFIGVGALVFIVGFLGCWGACIADSSSVPLWIYSFLVGLCIIGEIVIIIVVAIYWTSPNNEVAQSMYNDVHNKYIGEVTEDGLSTSWNTMQKEWQCCGSYGYMDYQGSKYDNTSVGANPDIWIPYTCCISQKEDPSCQSANDTSQIYSQGCYDALQDFLDTSAPIIIGLTAGFAALQILGLIFACCLIHDDKNSGKYV